MRVGRLALALLLVTALAVVPGANAQPSAHPIDIEQPCFHLTASDFWIELDDKRIFNLDPAEASNIQIHCDPGNASYTTIELTWHQHGVEMRFFAYLQSDGSSWWSHELRIYNGASQSDWLYAYGDFFRSNVGQPFQAESWMTTVDSGTGNATDGLPSGRIHFENLELIAFHQTVQAGTPGGPATDTGSSASQTADAAGAIQPTDGPQGSAKSTGIVMPDLGQAFGMPIGIWVIGTALAATGFGSFALGRRHGRTLASPAQSAAAQVGGGRMPDQLAAPMPKTLLVWSVVLGLPMLIVGILGLVVLAMISRTEEDIVGWTIQYVGTGRLFVVGLLAAVPLTLLSAHRVARKRWLARQPVADAPPWTPNPIASAASEEAEMTPDWIDLGPLPNQEPPSSEWVDLGPLSHGSIDDSGDAPRSNPKPPSE